MAKKGKNAPGGGRSPRTRTILRTLGIVFFIVLGGVLFNLDRLGQTGVELLKVKKFIPTPVRTFLPGEAAPVVKAVPESTLHGEILEVYDGDTPTLLADGKRYKLRLFGIDAPEADQRYGRESRDLLREKILGKAITAEVMNLDQYGRAVAKIRLGGRYINCEMVADGAAWHYAQYARYELDLAAAQRSAQERKIGLWNENAPTPPWEWRKAHKK